MFASYAHCAVVLHAQSLGKRSHLVSEVIEVTKSLSSRTCDSLLAGLVSPTSWASSI